MLLPKHERKRHIKLHHKRVSSKAVRSRKAKVPAVVLNSEKKINIAQESTSSETKTKATNGSEPNKTNGLEAKTTYGSEPKATTGSEPKAATGSEPKPVEGSDSKTVRHCKNCNKYFDNNRVYGQHMSNHLIKCQFCSTTDKGIYMR